jgi:2,4-dienoyl-CoA reductase-like NADH-dependent reductase (Old Yellow Enzyme family)
MVGDIFLKNRIVVAPLSRVSTCGDGIPTKQMTQYYTSYAHGGFSLIISEGTYTDLAYSQGYLHQPGIATESQILGWQKVTTAVHAAGGLIFIQLMHAGALSQGNSYRRETLAPSAIQPKGQKMVEYGGGSGLFAIPQAMTEADLQAAIAGFVQAAIQAQQAGFDGIEIHGANGYLIDQFITTYTNQRTDQYGGSVENRIRFAVETVEAVRRAVGQAYPVGIRLSQTKVNDLDYRWSGSGEGRMIFAALKQAGVDFIHLASEGRDWLESSISESITINQLAKQVAQVPIIANGGMHKPEQAAQVLTEGHGDLISIGRGAIANPDWANRLATGQPFEPFDHGMIEPEANLNNTQGWLSQHIA